MRQPLLFALLVVSAVFYFRYSTSPVLPAWPATAASAVSPAPRATVVVLPAPPAYDRWSTTSDRWKIGPNAQTDFAPFAPSEQANWNRSSVAYNVSGRFKRFR